MANTKVGTRCVTCAHLIGCYLECMSFPDFVVTYTCRCYEDQPEDFDMLAPENQMQWKGREDEKP